MIVQILTKARYIPLVMLCLLLWSCNGTTTVKKKEVKPVELVYPQPPEDPRFYFEMMLLSSAQVVGKDTETHWKELLTGEKERGEGLGKPFDVAACQGRVFVSDTVQRRVAAFDFANQRFFEIGTQEPGVLQKPLGINTDANCNLYVADSSQKTVFIYDKDGEYISAVGGSDWFHRLSHVAVNPDGNKIFAVDTGGVQTEDHRIRVFDVQTGEHLYDIGKRGKENGQLNLPRDVEVGPDGMVYVVDGANFRIQVFDQEGQFVSTFGSVGTRYGQFSRPKGIALDPSGNIYVTDAAFGNFQIFSPAGELLLYIGDRSNRPGPAKYLLPAGIDIDEDGRVYFVGQFYRKIDIFRPASLPAGEGHIGRALNAQ